MVRFITLALCFWVACERGILDRSDWRLEPRVPWVEMQPVPAVIVQSWIQAPECSRPCNAAVTCPMGWTCRDDPTRRSAFGCLKPPMQQDVDCPMAHVCSATAALFRRSGSVRTVFGDERCAEGFQCARPQTGRPEACLQVCEKDDDCSEGQCGDGLCRSSDGCGRGSDLCKPCVTDVECGSQSDFCVRNLVSGQRHCASACEDADDCPAGFLCQAFDGGRQCVPSDGRCEARCLGDEACSTGFQCVDGRCARRGGFEGLCAPCTSDVECADGLCLENPGRSLRACAPACGSDGDCPEGGVCLSMDSGQQVCVPRTGQCPVGVGAVGSRCHADTQCASGLCLFQGQEQRGGRCVRSCPCPAGERCVVLASGSTSVCVAGSGRDGDRCNHPVDCEGAFCLHLATESICSRSCRGDDECVQGWTCAVTAGDEKAYAHDGRGCRRGLLPRTCRVRADAVSYVPEVRCVPFLAPLTPSALKIGRVELLMAAVTLGEESAVPWRRLMTRWCAFALLWGLGGCEEDLLISQLGLSSGSPWGSGGGNFVWGLSI